MLLVNQLGGRVSEAPKRERGVLVALMWMLSRSLVLKGDIYRFYQRKRRQRERERKRDIERELVVKEGKVQLHNSNC